MRRCLREKTSAVIAGYPSIYAVPLGLNPMNPEHRRLVHAGQNIICVGMYDAALNYLLRNFEDWQATSIVLGFGGDYNQPDDPDDVADQGSRQPAAHTDTYVRKVLYRAPIVQVTESPLAEERRMHYIAIVRPDEALTDVGDPDAPFINEFGLEAYNGTLLAHYVTPADPDTNRAEQYAKSDVEWLVIDWEIEFVGSVPAEE